jgi:hypothetical protein
MPPKMVMITDARQVFSGHFVPVKPTPLAEPEYVTHSSTFFNELGLSDELALDEKFRRYFLVISLLPMSLCVRLAGRLAMHCRFMAPNIPNNVHLVLAMGMAMVGRYLYLKEYQWTALGNAIERWWPDAVLPWCRRARSTTFKCA